MLKLKLTTCALWALLLTLSLPSVLTAGDKGYNIRFKTADLTGAGTDSNIQFILVGTKGESKRIRLQDVAKAGWEKNSSGMWESEKSILERNSITRAYLSADQVGGDLGPIMQVRLTSDGKYAGSDWDLEYLTVDYMDTPVGLNAMLMGPPMISEEKAGQDIVNKHGVRSTFKHKESITGEEKIPELGNVPGILMTRSEKMVDPQGNPVVKDAAIYSIYAVDAIGNTKPVPFNLKKTTQVVDYVTLDKQTAERMAFGATAEVGYQPPDTGGAYGSIQLSAEYEQIKGENSGSGKESTIALEESQVIEVDPDTYCFRIIRTPGRIKMQEYRSTLKNLPFVASYVYSTDGGSQVIQRTFTKGVNADKEWNDYLGKIIATMGKDEYNRYRNDLKRHGILSDKANSYQDSLPIVEKSAN